MRKFAVFVFGLAAIAGSAAGRPRTAIVSATPKPRHWYTDKKLWIGEAVIVGSTMADANSTCRGLQRGGVEQNVALGPHPSCGHIYAFEAGATAYWTFFHFLDWFWVDGGDPDPNLGWRVYGYVAMPVAAFGVNGTAAIHNYRVSSSASPNAQIGSTVILHQEQIRAEFSKRVGEGLVR